VDLSRFDAAALIEFKEVIAVVPLLGGALPDTRAFEGCLKVETFAEEDGKSVLLIEEWESKKHQETYFQWRVETGLVDALAPFVSGPPVTRYYEIRSE
tara:strand:- start:258 stop:551 length:294 start_codon:yes stop_codon:yes gene_type:complete